METAESPLEKPGVTGRPVHNKLSVRAETAGPPLGIPNAAGRLAQVKSNTAG